MTNEVAGSGGVWLPPRRRRLSRRALMATAAAAMAVGLVEAGILGVMFARGGWHLLWRKQPSAPADSAEGRFGPASDGAAVVFLGDDLNRMRSRIDRIFQEVVPPPVSLGVGEAALWSRVRSLQAQIDHVFRDALVHPAPFGWSSDLESRLDRAAVFPGMDMADEGTNYLVTVSALGAGKDDIGIDLEGRLLTISVRGAARPSADGRAVQGHCPARFHTRIMLPEPVRGDAVEASLRAGTLSIRVPKAGAAASARKIVVN